jgi:hypothetical protein
MGFTRWRWVTVSAAVAGASAWYVVRGRRRMLTWGASDQEAADAFEGDALLPDAGIVSTRAVTIAASPEAVWPWLVQMGSGRAGAYSYDWIENALGLDMHSADEIVGEWQDLAVGDELPLGKGAVMVVRVLDAPRAFVLESPDGNWVWEFVLRPDGDGTRLISRNRIRIDELSLAARVGYRILMEPGSLIMERKMLRGIRARVEGGSAADRAVGNA